jgi:hypothetical protein
LAVDQAKNWRATNPRTGGRPSQELAGDHPKNWWATNPRTGGQPSQELAGNRAKNWRATEPSTGGRPTQELAGCSFHGKGVYFRALKERPLLEDRDRKDRRKWSQKRKKRSQQMWAKKKPHAVIDCKRYELYRNREARSFAAKRSVRGAYQKKGAEPTPAVVKPKGGKNKFPAKGVKVCAAVIKGRIRMWHYIDGRWNAKKAAAMYQGPLLKAMTKAFPGRGANAKWEVLEDNDPAGFKAGEALQAKRRAKIVTDDLPRRSPDFNVLDYSLWREVNKRMRQQERKFPWNKKETGDQFKERLRRTALGLPESVVGKAAGDMANRIKLCLKNKGGLFKEGRKAKA